MLELQNGLSSSYDVIWPASSTWIQLGDTSGVVQEAPSIFRSPVVLGVKTSIATRLGWVGADVTVQEILSAANSGSMRFMMASASQSDSGVAAYLGFLYAFAGQPDILTISDLQNEAVMDQTRQILGRVARTSGGSTSLTADMLAEYDHFDAMFNYESSVIEANQSLEAEGREPLYVVYPIDGTAISNFPFAFLDRGNQETRTAYEALSSALRSDAVQKRLLDLGRRAGIGPYPSPALVSADVFNPAWGIDTQRVLTPIPLPNAEVVREAINLYQSILRKPSLTVYALDFSESMKSSGSAELKAAMHLLLDQESAATYFLQAGPADVTIVILFSNDILEIWTVVGNDPDQLARLANQIEATEPTGGTDIYTPVIEGYELIRERGTDGFFSSIVLLTDGESINGKSVSDLQTYLAQSALTDVPVFSITFGDASERQVQEIASLTKGRVFDGSSGLSLAFRTVRGYS
jgi:Ca-activated chloride channel family protein